MDLDIKHTAQPASAKARAMPPAMPNLTSSGKSSKLSPGLPPHRLRRPNRLC